MGPSTADAGRRPVPSARPARRRPAPRHLARRRRQTPQPRRPRPAGGRTRCRGGTGGDLPGGPRPGDPALLQVCLQRIGHGPRAREARRRVWSESLSIDRLEGRRDAGPDIGDARRLRGDPGHGDGGRGVAFPGPATAQQLVQDDAKAVDVRGGRRRLPERLLRAEVVDRSERRARKRQAGVRPGARNSEVGHFHAPVGIQHDVAGLHIAVDDPAVVCRIERSCDLGNQAGGLARRERAVAAEERGEILAVDQLHHEVRALVVDAEVVDRHDAGVAERRSSVSLLAKSRDEVGVAPEFPVEDLDGDIAAELAVGGAVDRGHAALAQQLDEAIPPTEHVAETSHALSLSSGVGSAPRGFEA